MNSTETLLVEAIDRKGRVEQLLAAARQIRKSYPDVKKLHPTELFRDLYTALDRFPQETR